MLLTENLNPESTIDTLENELRANMPAKWWTFTHGYTNDAYVGQTKDYPYLLISKYENAYNAGAMTNLARKKYEILLQETDWVILFPNQRRKSMIVERGNTEITRLVNFILEDAGLRMI